MPRELRSKCEAGSARWAERRVRWLSMGLSEADFDRPKVAIVNTSSKLSLCFQHVDGLAVVVAEAIRNAGGVPLEIRTAAPSVFRNGARRSRHLIPVSALILADIQTQVEGAELDGMVLLSSCDETTPAHLMAASRLNIPSIVVTCGYQPGDQCGDRQSDVEAAYKGVVAVREKTMPLGTLAKLTASLTNGTGTCSSLSTTNSMHCMAEALGMAQAGNAPIRAGSALLEDYAASAGAQIIQLIDLAIKPRDIMTAAAFRNAVRVAIAIGTSVNVMRHLGDLAAESGVDVNITTEFEAAATVGQITRLRPNGPDRIESFSDAGGCSGAMHQIASVLDLDAITVSGQTLAENLAGRPTPNSAIIRPLNAPFRREPGLVILRGNLAPQGAISKLSAMPSNVRHFLGPAVVFECEADATDAVSDRRISEGQVVVLRIKCSTEPQEKVQASSLLAKLSHGGLSDRTAVICDAELGGETNGIMLCQVLDPSVDGDPLAAVRTGDMIDIDLNARSINLRLSPIEIQERMAASLRPYSAGSEAWPNAFRQLARSR